MKELFKNMLLYSHHFNDELIRIAQENEDKVNNKIISLLSHILTAHAIWNARINEIEAEYGVWQDIDLEKMKELNQKNFDDSMEIAHKFDLDLILEYQDSKGNYWENSVKDILVHVVNHSSYHRGQIAQQFRNCDLEPIPSDYCLFRREKDEFPNGI